jgi:hypothetical protein
MVRARSPMNGARAFSLMGQDGVEADEVVEPEVGGEEAEAVDAAAAEAAADRGRRNSERFLVQGWAEVMTVDGTMMVRGQITDISLTGCYVESHGAFDLPMNSAVEMIFRIKGDEFRPEAVTRVVRSGHGAGFVFLNMNAKVTLQIQALIDVLGVHM